MMNYVCFVVHTIPGITIIIFIQVVFILNERCFQRENIRKKRNKKKLLNKKSKNFLRRRN